MPIAYGGAGAILGASVGESDLKIVATFTGKLINNLIARPGIKSAKDLRNKTVGVQSIGGTNSAWQHAVARAFRTRPEPR